MRRVKHTFKNINFNITLIGRLIFFISCVIILYYGYKQSDIKQDVTSSNKTSQRHVLTNQISPNDLLTNQSRVNHAIDMTSYLSFIDPYTPDCEEIFKNETDKKAKLDEFKEILSEIDKYNALVNSTRQELLNKEGRCLVGHALQYIEETYFMAKLFRSEFVKTICETGFNVGHSTLLWLLLKPDIKVYSFDINRLKCTEPMAKYLLDKYPDRLQVIFGDSTVTLPEFHRNHPDVKCDVTIIDGGHTRKVAEADVANFYDMTDNMNFVFIDNYPDDNFSPALAYGWENAKRNGRIDELFRCKYATADPGFTLGRYLH